MNKNTILSIAVFALAVYGIMATKKCTEHAAAHATTLSMVAHKDDTIKYLTGRNGIEIAEKETVIGDLLDANTIYKNDMDSVCEQLNLKPADKKHISSVDEIGTVATGHANIPLSPLPCSDTVHDTVCRPFVYSEKWFSISGKVCSDSIHLEWTEMDSLVLVSGDWKRNGFLKPRTKTTYAWSYNPHVHIKGLTDIKITEQKLTHFAVGPYVGVDLGGKVTFGLAITYSLIRF